jgi:hypothetical protein
VITKNTESEDKIKQDVRTIYFNKMSKNSQHHGLYPKEEAS